MADNKKSFVLYTDLIHTVNKMKDVQAGQLFKTILSYVNDENPIVENPIVDLVFEPIKQQLKRDLKSWTAERSLSGRAGNLKKHHPDLYEKFKAGTLTIDEAENTANARKTPLMPANTAVNVNDTVNVTVTVSDTVNEKKKEEVVAPSALHPLQEKIIKEFKRVSKMSEQLTPIEAKKLNEKFSAAAIDKVLNSMENRADLLKKYVSVYRTVNNWCSRDTPSVLSIAKSATNKIIPAGQKFNLPGR